MIVRDNPNESHYVDEKKIKCPKCGSRNFARQGGIEIDTKYINGEKVETIRLPLDTRIFCDDCQEEINV